MAPRKRADEHQERRTGEVEVRQEGVDDEELRPRYEEEARLERTWDDLPADMQQFLTLNRTLSAVWPVITACGQVPADAADWDGVDGKLRYLDLPEKVA
mgnify:CR=1 FL=1